MYPKKRQKAHHLYCPESDNTVIMFFLNGL